MNLPNLSKSNNLKILNKNNLIKNNYDEGTSSNNKNNNFINHNINLNILKRKENPVFFIKFKKYRRTDFNNKIIASIQNMVPNNYIQAINCKDHLLWEQAMDDELCNFYDNNIMIFVKHVPKGKRILTLIWIYTNKINRAGIVIKHKVRIVAQGFRQLFGVDFFQTFAPTLNIDGLKLIIAIASKFKWHIFQLDIKAAYLNAKIDTDIYTTIPPGDANFGKRYWKLRKALYGLKQSGCQWYLTISEFLIEQGFIQLSSEKCIFKKTVNGKLVCIIGLYVDDMAIAGLVKEINNIINKIKQKFKISKCEPINYILGIKIEKNNFNYSKKILLTSF